MSEVNYSQRRKHRKLLIKYKNDAVATQTAIVNFYEKKLTCPVATADPSVKALIEQRLDEAYEKLGAAIGH